MKESFYFTHDYNARNDENIISLRRKLKIEGYGVYWFLVEMLAESSTHKLSLDKLEDYAFEMRVDPACVRSVLIDFGLFQNDGKFFWSNRLLRHFQERGQKSMVGKANALKRWNKATKNATAMQLQCKPNAIKESKVKESKVKKNYNKKNLFSFAERLGKIILKNSPTDAQKYSSPEKMPGFQNWPDEFLKILEIDKLNETQVSYILGWLESGKSWWTQTNNIRSAATLRKQIPRIVGEIKSNSLTQKQHGLNVDALIEREKGSKNL